MFCVSEKDAIDLDRVQDGQGQAWYMNAEALEEHGEPKVLENSNYLPIKSNRGCRAKRLDSTGAFRQEVWTF